MTLNNKISMIMQGNHNRISCNIPKIIINYGMDVINIIYYNVDSMRHNNLNLCCVSFYKISAVIVAIMYYDMVLKNII